MIQGTRLIEASPKAYSYPLLIKSLLHSPIHYLPDNEIVYRDKIRHDYREFYRRINRLGSGLTAMGVKPGDTIAVLDWDSYRYLECYYAIPGLGAVLHCVNVRLSPEQVLFTMDHAEDTVVLVHEDFLPLVEAIKDKLTGVRTWILMKEGDAAPESTIEFDAEYEEVLARGQDQYEFPDFDENSVATMFYTTGTTGDPKGVCFSHRHLVLHTLSTAVAVGSYHANGRFRSNDVYMPLTPMFHVHAWGLPYVATLLGVKQVYPGRYEPEMLLKLLVNEKVTFSHCVPTILHMLVGSPAVKNFDLSRWKVVIGGASFPSGLARAALGLGIDVYAGYGMSETCPVLTLGHLKPDKLDEDEEARIKVLIATGLPIPMVDLKVVDPAMNELPRDGSSAGEIVVRAPWLTQGYFKNPEKGDELWEGGYLHTGDVAHIDQDGYVRITDRIKDVIKTGGEWVSSLLLESLISQHTAVSEVAVVGIPDEKWGERPLAMIVPAPEEKESFSGEDLSAFMNRFVDDGTIPKYAVPDKIVVVDQIPKTSVGKINKKEIRLRVTS